MPNALDENSRWRAVKACDELSFWHEWASSSLANFSKDLEKRADKEHLTGVIRALSDMSTAANNLKRELVRLRGRGLNRTP